MCEGKNQIPLCSHQFQKILITIYLRFASLIKHTFDRCFVSDWKMLEAFVTFRQWNMRFEPGFRERFFFSTWEFNSKMSKSHSCTIHAMHILYIPSENLIFAVWLKCIQQRRISKWNNEQTRCLITFEQWSFFFKPFFAYDKFCFDVLLYFPS